MGFVSGSGTNPTMKVSSIPWTWEEAAGARARWFARNVPEGAHFSIAPLDCSEEAAFHIGTAKRLLEVTDKADRWSHIGDRCIWWGLDR